MCFVPLLAETKLLRAMDEPGPKRWTIWSDESTSKAADIVSPSV
jgi:hypothetical protein